MSETKATRAAYGEALVKLGHENDKIVALERSASSTTMTMTFAKDFQTGTLMWALPRPIWWIWRPACPLWG